MELRAKKLGVNTIRLDTFDWQGKDFYKAVGYELVGNYSNIEDGYAKYFFLSEYKINLQLYFYKLEVLLLNQMGLFKSNKQDY